MRGRVYRDGEVTWRHLAASCAVPPVYAPVRLDGRWYTDGGVLDPLPVWAAAELGATEVEALQVLGTFPSAWLGPIVAGFRKVFADRVEVPEGVRVRVWEPGERLGGLKQSLWGTQGDIERWIEMGVRDAQKPFPL